MGRALTQRHRDTEVAKVRLGEVCRIVGGGTPSKSKPEYYVGKIPWASVRDMKDKILSSTEYSISEIAVENSATNIIPKGEVIISTHVGLGKVSILAQDTAINQDLKAIIPTSLLLRGYLYHWFVSQANFIVTHGHGITVKGVSVDFIKVLEIPLPPLAEQKRIAGELDRICELKKNAEERLALMDQLVKSKFVEMFGKFERNTPIARIVAAKIERVRKRFSLDDQILYVDISAVNKRDHIIETCTPYIVAEAPSRAQQCIRQGDVLVSTVRPNLKNIALHDKKGDNYIASTGFCVLRAENCEPQFLKYSVLEDDFTDAMISVAKGATYPAIKDSDILDYKIPLPPLALQRKFAAFVESVDKSKAALKETIATMETLYKERLQEYFA